MALSKKLRVPKGIRILKCKLRDPPIALSDSTVVNTKLFAEKTLRQLKWALHDEGFKSGNRSVTDLITRLAKVGVTTGGFIK
jgi:hypothetical protein